MKIHTNKKYVSQNPISRLLISHFYATIRQIIRKIEFSNLVDLGCGEGIILKMLEKEISHKACMGIDLNPVHIKLSKLNAPFCKYQVGNIYQLQLEKNSFEMVICLEVLEHLEYPEKALDEIDRISSKYVLLSVPREPLWRILNMIRGSYLLSLGNTPGHINHYSSKIFVNLINKKFEVLEIYNPLPWTVVLAKKK